VGAPVVSGVDAAPVLDAAEHVFVFVTLAVERRVVRDGDLAVGFGRDACGDAALRQCVAEPVAVVAFVGDHLLCRWQGIEKQYCAPVIAGLAFGEQHDDGAALAIGDGVQFGVQSAFGAPDTSG
jgi:hypothetical protein